MPANSNRRIRVTLFVFLLVFAAVAVRAVFLQTVEAGALTNLANQQQVQQLDLPARRGTIFDRDGNELAVGEETKTIYATPYLVKDPAKAAGQLAPLLGVDSQSILAKLADRRSGFVYLARKIDPQAAARVQQLGIAGLGEVSEEKRVYPQKTLAAQVLGFAGTDNHGLAGMELQMDKVLAGTPGRQRVVTDASGQQIENLSLDEGSRGTDVYLTIDQSIQYQAEKVLADTVSKWSALGGEAVVMNPKTGEILAMADLPSEDANNFQNLNPEQTRNRTVTDTYEPGSIFKAITSAAGLEDGAVVPGQIFHLPTELELGGYTIKDAIPRGPVDWDLGNILVHSSNIGAVTVGMRVGKDKLCDWINRFGIGSPTGIDFPGEAAGSVPPPGQWSGSTIGNVPIGQGVSVTALQMTEVYATIANDGVSIKPHLVKRVGTRDTRPSPGKRIISDGTARQLNAYLTEVVNNGAPRAQIAGYQVAGKSGTSQKIVNGKYSDSKVIDSFVGFAPSSDPQLVVLVQVDEPHPFAYSEVVAEPAFQNIMQFSLEKLGIAP